MTGHVAAEIRTARLGAGLSIRDAAASIGMSAAAFWRIEHNAVSTVSVRSLELASAAVGLSLSMRAYPVADPVRDAAHLALLGRMRARLPPGAPWHTEVPMPIAGDLRALDARTELQGSWIGFEAETRVIDIQAVQRKALLKERDAHLGRIMLLVADTRANRAVIAANREALRGSFPLDTRAILAALSAGQVPPADGIVIL